MRDGWTIPNFMLEEFCAAVDSWNDIVNKEPDLANICINIGLTGVSAQGLAGVLEWWQGLPNLAKQAIIGTIIVLGPAAAVVALIVLIAISPLQDTPQSVVEARAPGVPTEKDGFYPPKHWNGEKVRAPDGRYGYPDKDGNVWVPTGNTGHGGPHWDVEGPSGNYGDYRNVYPSK